MNPVPAVVLLAFAVGVAYTPWRQAGWTSPGRALLLEAGALVVAVVIAWLERAITMTLVFIGQFGALGLVIAAKALTRFRALDDRDFAEYVLIGTLASLLFALLIGIAVRFVMFWG